MTIIRYVEDVFIEFAHAVDLRQVSVQPQDIPAINSFQNVILTGKPLTRAQSSFVLKILTKYKIGSKMVGIDYHDSIDNPTWRHPFRVIDSSRSVSVEQDEDGGLQILMKFPYQIKEPFEKELPNLKSMWDSTLMSRVIKLKDANVIAIREFCEKYEFVLDQSFVDLCDSVEEIWNQEENFLPHSVVKNKFVTLINANEDAKEYFEINKTDSLEENMFLAKSMNFCLKLEEKNLTLIQKIATAHDNYFYTNDIKNVFEILKSLPTAVNRFLASSRDNPIKSTGIAVFPGPSEIVKVTELPDTASLVASGSWDATRLIGIFPSGARSRPHWCGDCNSRWICRLCSSALRFSD